MMEMNILITFQQPERTRSINVSILSLNFFCSSIYYASDERSYLSRCLINNIIEILNFNFPELTVNNYSKTKKCYINDYS